MLKLSVIFNQLLARLVVGSDPNGIETLSRYLNTKSSYNFSAAPESATDGLVSENSTSSSLFTAKNTTLVKSTGNTTTFEMQHSESASTLEHAKHYHECGIYLAPSSIENAGFGMYAGRDYAANHIVGEGLGISLLDFGGHNEYTSRSSALLGDYYWACTSELCDFEAYDVSMMNSNFGAFTNDHPYERNIAEPSLHFRDSMVDHHSPGRGAFTYYDVTYVSSKEIQKGSEFFMDYGDQWTSEREGFDDYPISQNYVEAEKVIRSIVSDPHYRESTLHDKETMIQRAKQDLGNDEVATKSLIPDSAGDLEFLFQNGMTSLSLKDRIRSMDWLKDNGICMDNIQSGPSTIRDAGRGAFAMRFMEKGSVIAPMPLLHVNKAYFNMYELAPDEDEDLDRDGDKVLGHQQLINYCFGHEETTMLLCSFTSANLINHARCSEGDGTCKFEPNAAYRWSSWEAHEKWLKMPVERLLKKEQRALSLEIVALRDIDPGEEILFDYGEAWDKAWAEHSRNWTTPPSSLGYGRVSDMRTTAWDSKVPIRTLNELKDQPYPENIVTVCYYWESSLHDHVYTNVTMRSMDSPNEFITKRVIDGSSFFPIHDDPRPNSRYWPCSIYERSDDGRSYTVRLFAYQGHDTSWSDTGVALFLENFPKESIEFVHKPYTSDQHLSSSFRHPIGLRDDMVPPKW
eukprot:CAMPEP_0196809040 /NCGR_PEP_ID=MMETSP1362-20130617/9000_1 /TAXON_ID=163516 /ORGANISM="Leptocylindrus danicus, Strain CCMP1856" /LENGTH=684 /DNA_ID=CAMNT_0042183585 /DNA_START=106 /DNA_END=2157 /DNA_ORIENTATION=+